MIKRLWAAGERFRRGNSVTVRPAEHRVDAEAADAAMVLLGSEGEVARRLSAAAEMEAAGILSLSPLSTQLALDYLERLARPIPSLTPSTGVRAVTGGYAARMAVEQEPASFAAPEQLPVLASLPPLRNGRPRQDLLTRAVKATRRRFPTVRAVPPGVWDGFVLLLTARIHDAQPASASGEEGGELLAGDVVEGLARFGWVLRLVDVRYGLEPELRAD